MDPLFVHALNAFLVRHDAVEDVATAYGAAAEVLFLGVLLGAFVAVRRTRRRDVRRAVAAAGLSAAFALATAQVLARVIDRPRPFVADPGSVHLFAPHAADPGFPSDHATAAFAIAVAILTRNRTAGLITLAFAVALGVQRVGAGVHYPTDALAGAALGSAVALACSWIPAVRHRLDWLADRASHATDVITAAVLPRARAG